MAKERTAVVTAVLFLRTVKKRVFTALFYWKWGAGVFKSERRYLEQAFFEFFESGQTRSFISSFRRSRIFFSSLEI